MQTLTAFRGNAIIVIRKSCVSVCNFLMQINDPEELITWHCPYDTDFLALIVLLISQGFDFVALLYPRGYT